MIVKLDKIMTMDMKAPMNCTKTMAKTMELVQMMSTPERMANMSVMVERLAKAMYKLINSDLTFIQFVDRVVLLLRDLQAAANDPSLRQIFQFIEDKTVINSIMEPLVQGLLAAKPAYVKLQDIVKNSTSIVELMRQVGQLSEETLEGILASTVGIDVGALLNISKEQIEELACNRTALAAVLTLPASSPLSLANISAQLCKIKRQDKLDDLLQTVDVAKLLYQLLTTSTSPIDWLTSLTKDFAELIENTGSLFKLTELLSDMTIDNLSKTLPELQRFIRSKEPEKIFESITKLINDLKPISGDPNVRRFIDDLAKFSIGIRGLEIFKLMFPFNVRLADVIKRPADMKHFLLKTVNMTEDAASALLNSSFSYVQFMNMSRPNIVDHICHPEKLSKLLVLPDTANATTISTELCAINESKAAEVLDHVIQHLSIGDFVKTIITSGLDDLLKTSNISLDKVKDSFDKFRPISDDFQELVDDMKGFSSDLEYDAPGLAAGQVMPVSQVEALGSAVCGNKNALKFSDTFSMGSAFGGDGQIKTADSFTDDMKKEMKSLKSASCQSIYENVHSMTGGSIIWAYLKPLMMGKVLFTPDVPESRLIMRQANSVFDEMSGVIALLKSVNNIGKNLKGLDADFATKMKQALDSPLIRTMLQSESVLTAEDMFAGLQMLDVMLTEDMQKVLQYIDEAIPYSECIDTERFAPVQDEEMMIAEARKLSDDKKLIAGVVFLDLAPTTNRRRKRRATTPSLPKHISYKIRLDLDNTPALSPNVVNDWESGPKDNFAEDLRYLRHFIPLQDMIDNAIISAQTGTNYQGPERETKQFPYPCHSSDNFLKYSNAYLLPIMMIASWMVFVSIAVKTLVSDRELGIEETLKIMGLKSTSNFLAWFISLFVCMLLVVALFAIVLKFGGLLPYSDPTVIFVYLTIFSLSAIMLSYMVSAFFTLTSLASLVAILLYLVSYVPYMVIRVRRWELRMLFWHKMVTMIASCSAFSFAASFVTRFEAAGVGIQWSNIHDPTVDMRGSFSWCCLMMLVDSAGYFLIGWYFRNIFPGKYGIAQPWYFPLSPRYWGCGCCVRVKKGQRYSPSTFCNPMFEEKGAEGDHAKFAHEKPMDDRPVGISMRHLSKKHNGKLVVDNLSADFHLGEITALLGYNGAGKTTTINMLCGMYAPSSGTAHVNGKDVCKDWMAIRRDIGICPQNNMLYETLTVEEHLRFFASLKSNMSRKMLDVEVDGMLATIGLWNMRREKVLTLSGGMKRRLAVALAFIGGSSTIVLDEPTAGVDPVARRQIWDLIVKYKKDRTVILTTHHLEEADILSDRIFVMNKGKLIGSGSPMFLKRQFGRGYELNISKSDGFDVNTLLSFVKERLPGAYVDQDLGSEAKLVLPSADGQTNSFRSFFNDLDREMAALAVAGYGVSDTSLDQVFVSLCSLADSGLTVSEDNIAVLHREQNNQTDSAADSAEGNTEPAQASDSPRPPVKLEGGLSLYAKQVGALMTKRLHHHKRYLRGIIPHVLLPCLLVALAAWASMDAPKPPIEKSLMLSPVIYGGDGYNSFYKVGLPTVYNRQFEESLLGPPGIGTFCMKTPPKPLPNTEAVDYASERFSCEDRNTSFTTPDYVAPPLVNGQAPSCRCVSDRQVCDAGAEGRPVPRRVVNPGETVYNLADRNISHYLLTTHAQFMNKRFGGWQFEADDISANLTSHSAIVWFNNRAPHALPTFYSALSNTLLRAAVSDIGGAPEDYGITVYNEPLPLTREQLSTETILSRAAHMGIAIMIIAAICFIPAGFSVLPVLENVRQEKRLQFVYGVGSKIYWFTTLFWDLCMWLIPVCLMVLILYLFKVEVFVYRLNLPAIAAMLMLYGWALLPVCYLVSTRFRDSGTAFMTVYCAQLFIGLISVVCTFLLSLFATSNSLISSIYTIVRYVLLALPPFVLGDAFIVLMRNQVLAELLSAYGEDVYVSPFTFKMLGWHMVALGAVGLVALVLTVVTEEGAGCCQSRPKRRRAKTLDLSPDSDTDVLQEQTRISDSPEVREDVVVFNGLSKCYRSGRHKITAVDDVYAGVRKGECFGLLGENGAGKTTLFKLLTGELTPSCGRAVICGSTVHGTSPAFRTCVGYCPQFDALDLQLTGREILYFYAKLKGVPSNTIVGVVEQVVKDLELQTFADKVCGQYSGGMRRRLSVGVALVADPLVLLLDEPTAGMDVQMRRLVWSALNRVTKNNSDDLWKTERSIIVTSHRMDECEAACTRMSVMVNGRFRCLGSPQYLKAKYGDGYTVAIHLKSESLSGLATEVMQKSFPDAVLKEQRHRLMEFSVPSCDGFVATIFGVLESQRELVGIVDYSVKQTTLDQVFLAFCRLQSDGINSSRSSSNCNTVSSGGDTITRPGFRNAAFYEPALADDKAAFGKEAEYEKVSIGMEEKEDSEHLDEMAQPTEIVVNPTYGLVADNEDEVTRF